MEPMKNKDILPVLLANKEPVEKERCIAWDDDANYFISGYYIERLDNGSHRVKTDWDNEPVFNFRHAVKA